MTSTIANVTVSDFDTLVLASAKPVLVDFWADWCGPCRALAPTLDEIALDYRDRLAVVKVDVTVEDGLRQRFAAPIIPTLIMFKDGAETGRNVGSVSKTRLAVFIDAHC